MTPRAQAILRVDGGAALIAGIAMLALRKWLGALLGFPSELVWFVGVSNLVYASYSGSLAALAAWKRTPTRRSIDVLIVANAVWVAVCMGVLAMMWRSASVFGLAHVALEGLFVGSLALAEYRVVRPAARTRA